MRDFPMIYGDNLRIQQAVTDFQVTVLEDDQVELRASIVPDAGARAVVLPTAASVAVHMDQKAATQLLKRLRETFQTKGWPLP